MDVLMPKLSDTMEEGKILRWLKHEGDVVKAGDLLAEVETDKANMDIESFDDGVLTELRVPEGQSAPVGAVIAVLSSEGAAARPKTTEAAPAKAPAQAAPPAAPDAARTPSAAAPSAAKPATPAATKAPAAAATKTAPPRREAPATESTSGGSVKASPLARKIAGERGIDLARVSGSGPGGRVVEKDVEAVGGEAPAPASPKSSPPAPKTGSPRPAAGERRALSRIRKTTATRMADAKRDVPHFYASCDLDVGEVMRLREELVGLGAAYTGLTVTHFLLRACGLALRRVPEMNASFDGDAVVLHERVNVGLATATDDGLLVPVIHDCDTTGLDGIAAEARAVVERARAGKPAGEDLSGATFTISNLGMYPVAHFAAVVNPPQAGILAVGTTRAVPIVRDGQIVAGHLMTVTLSCDHRAVDGAIAGRFLAALKPLVEQPIVLVV